MNKLNELVAIRVMGWKAPLIRANNVPSFPVSEWDYKNPPPVVEEWRANYHWRNPAGACFGASPEYATDMNRAWEVATLDVDEYCFHTTMQRYKEGYYGPHWCGIAILKHHMSRHEKMVWAQAETAPLAICLAALRALGTSEEDIVEAMKKE